jgi:hypothetical protein
MDLTETVRVYLVQTDDLKIMILKFLEGSQEKNEPPVSPQQTNEETP